MTQSGEKSRGPLKGNLLLRPRIDSLLEEGIKFPELIVAAGAGFGKTQAVASFLENSPYRGVWQQLTLLDNLPSRFWASFTFTVSLHRKELGERLRSFGFPDTIYKFDKFLHFFTKELYVDNQFVIFVFDDLHLIENESVLQFFKYFASAKLENICLVGITRDTDAYTFDSSVYTITAEDLRFTKEESTEYFEKQNIPKLASSKIDKIYSYTRGWPVALYLVSLQLQKEMLDWDERISNSQQMIFKLIDKEIFSRYSEAEQDLLVKMSILNFFPKGLLQIFVKESKVDIEKLMSNNVFITYDYMAENYYLHQVFLDFLEEKRLALPEWDENSILLEAACWCKENSYTADAVDYYYRCGAYELLWEVIDAIEGKRYPKNEAAFYIDYIEKMPESFLHSNPMRRIIYAMFLFNNLNLEESLHQMDLVYKQLAEGEDTQENRLLTGEAYAASGLIALGRETPDFVDDFKKAAELLPDGSRWWKGNLRLVEYGSALNINGPGKGELAKSLKSFKEGMPYASKVLNGAGFGVDYLAAAEADFLTGHIKKCQKDAYTALYMSQEKVIYDVMDSALFLLLRSYLMSGDIDNIRDILSKLQKPEDATDEDEWDVADIAIGWFYSEIGMLSKVAGWISDNREDGSAPLSIDRERLLRVRCLIEEGGYYEALAVLDRLEAVLNKKNTLISLIYTNVYRGIAYYSLDEKKQAVKAIKAAYDLAYGNNLIMPFIEYGHRTRALLGYILREESSGFSKEWLDNVHVKASTYAKRRSFIVSRFAGKYKEDAPDYGLSARELELIRNLSQGLKREEIADSMFVSPHTVKSMLKTVYNKLGAINNADAIRIATGAGLL